MGQTAYTNIPGGLAKAPFGGVTLILRNGAFRALNYKPVGGSRRIDRLDTNGDKAENMRRAEPKSQSGITLQIPKKDTNRPELFEEFICPVDGQTVMVIDSIGEGREEGAFWMLDIDVSANTA